MEYEKREFNKKSAKILNVHPYLSEDECKYALKECKDDEVSHWVIRLLLPPKLPEASGNFGGNNKRITQCDT